MANREQTLRKRLISSKSCDKIDLDIKRAAALRETHVFAVFADSRFLDLRVSSMDAGRPVLYCGLAQLKLHQKTFSANL